MSRSWDGAGYKPKTEEHVSPMPGQMYLMVENFKAYESGDALKLALKMEDGNIITSLIADKLTHHKVIIDLDLPAKLIPSSTPGHFHLYVDHEIPFDSYFELLAAMEKCGLIEKGYLGAAKSHGFTGVRLPWVKKELVSEAEAES